MPLGMMSTGHQTVPFTSITFDAATNGGLVNPGTSLTWSHTCTGSNLILWVGAFGDTTDVLTGATYNGVSMTLAVKTSFTSSRYVYLWYLVAPATGANNVVVTASGSFIIDAASASYANAKQTGQPDATGTAGSNGTSLTGSVTTVANNSWSIMCYRPASGALTAGAGVTQRINNTALILGDSGGNISPAGSYSMTCSNSSIGTDQAMALASFGHV